MAYFNILDLTFSDVEIETYDLAIFFCGYEERSIFFPGLRAAEIREVLVFGFSASAEDIVFKHNESFYLKNFSAKPILVEYSATGIVFSTLKEKLSKLAGSSKEPVRILVDYSSMPRIWYSEILNFIKSYEFERKIVLDFVYSVGEHKSSNVTSQLSEPIVLPGCEAVSAYNKQTIGIFSLGFGEGGPICLHHKIEPDKTFSLVARPGALEDYTETALQNNKFFLENCSDGLVFAPLSSVQQSYDTIREIFYPYQDSAVIVLVPFGPKPHALASIVTAINYPEVTCLYSSLGSTGCAVKPTGELVISRVEKLESSPYFNG